MNLEAISSVRQVKQSHPQIQHANSILSSSAGYLSEYASDSSSTPSGNGYETPPSRLSTPVHRQMQMQESEMTLPARPQAAVPAPLTVGQGANGTVPPYDTLGHNRLSPPTPGVDDTPYIRFAIEQLTFDEELAGRGRHSSEVPDYSHSQQTISGQPVQTTPPQQQKQRQPPRRPLHFPRASSEQSRAKTGDIMLLPSDPPRDRHQLGFVPTPLRLISLGPLVLLCLLMMVGLIFSNIFALTNHGLYDYDGNFTPRYFVFEYLPPMLGFIIIFWLFVVQAAIYRTAPYFSMSKKTPTARRDRTLQTMPITPANFVLPDWRFFHLGEPMIGAVLTVFWLTNWTIPLLSCLYGTQWFTSVGTPRFRWTPVQGLAWFIVVQYLVLIAALIYCMIRFRRRNSALMWDPTCLADLIILFQRSNLLPDYFRSETKEDLPNDLPPRYCRLGYWTTNQSPDFFYAVGEANHPYLELSSSSDKYANEKMDSSRTSGESQEVLRNSQASSFARMLHSPWVRHRWCPWYLRDGAILAWAIAAVLLLVAFLVVSFVNHAVRGGFFAMLPARTQPNGFSPANFLFSFLPSLLGMFLFLAWQPIDVYFRAVQAYVNLSKHDGATARRSLLLSYNAQLPGVVSTKALINRDWKVAYFSFVSLMAATIPVLAGGVFTALLFANGEVRMTASMPGYIALCVLLSIYALSYLIIWPTRFRYLPHSVDSVGGNLSFLYASRLLKDSSIRNIRTKADFIARLNGRVGTTLTGDGRRAGRRTEKHVDQETKYGFGIYTGVDGKEHLGIDRMQRPGSGEMLVLTSRQNS
ncbi:hypothetical protein LTR70_002933 [Exophiala xenobiotica]|uniref:Phosphoribosylaminoimidazole-succinocarboxamide synthase n=1 Tax=Lithohypha guttulata TaxID=1690604 RepID=A0ABR0KHL0_9EURO|nr:hypothetical protein LTR24_002459 [Lithohypha guttulata]KAK5324486.1 hypothetical protein LTR70_002933 [Exophiala xenobiotica]